MPQDPSTPPVDLPDGRSFQVRGAWCDIYEAICNAKHMIYITGWSVYDKITLVRDPTKPMLPSQWPTLGEEALCSAPHVLASGDLFMQGMTGLPAVQPCTELVAL